jgi:peptidoglycan-associated lipoprotein
MKLRSFWLVLILGLGLVVSGCTTTDTVGDDDAMASETPAGAEAGGYGDAEQIEESEGARAAGAEGIGQVSGEDLLEDASGPLAERVIYFEFDSSTVSSEYTDVLRAHGEFLATHPEYQVIVEGHTDERGSREYNLALGERRAQAVAQILKLNGAAADQVQVTSYGEEQPAASGHNEQAWAQNRRAELVYQR